MGGRAGEPKAKDLTNWQNHQWWKALNETVTLKRAKLIIGLRPMFAKMTKANRIQFLADFESILAA